MRLPLEPRGGKITMKHGKEIYRSCQAGRSRYIL